MPPSSSTTSMTLKRIHREISDLKREDMGGMTLGPTEQSLFNWRGSIPGPSGSCYEGGLFWMEITLPSDYPFSSPKVVFTTRIYHMNISDRGNVCIDLLKNNWSPALSLYKVLLSLSSLLTDPNPKDPLVPQIATEYVRNRVQHNKTAARWTQLYALPPNPKPAPSSQPAPSSKRPATSSQNELIIIDDSPERPLRRKRERATDPDEGRRKRPHRTAAPGSIVETSASGSGTGASDVIVIDD
ncbi:ubiquitin-conjugating enzyme/RWD-like protein [Gautieria morchelliformis]|nr:ubiquitin-conjugating enzyme/RWD-like protein [Gautieria morchelliformis]